MSEQPPSNNAQPDPVSDAVTNVSEGITTAPVPDSELISAEPSSAAPKEDARMELRNPIFVPTKFPNTGNRVTIFLAGGMGKMPDGKHWRRLIREHLEGYDCAFFEPTRKDWGRDWKTKDNEHYYAQVRWETEMMNRCDIMAVYFEPSTYNQITLMEFGMHVRDPKGKVQVCCPIEFSAFGAVQIACENFGISHSMTFDEWKVTLAKAVKAKSDQMKFVESKAPEDKFTALGS